MAILKPRNATPHEEHAYYEWAQKFLWNDYRCDHCNAMLTEDHVFTHDVTDVETGRNIPTTHYCDETCFALEKQPRRIVRGGLE